MANEIANIHNDLIDLPLRKFNASEIDILTAICYRCQNEESNKVILKLSDVKKMSHYRSVDNDRFLKEVENTNKKLMSLNFTIRHSAKSFTQFVLFPTFRVDGENGNLEVKVNEEFTYLLNSLNNSYTSLELKESTALKSSYSKGIYKKLREFRKNEKPFWKVKLEDFREYLDIPNSYRITDINKVVLNPAMEELSTYFKGLKIEPYFEKRKGQRGRPKVAGYIFSFKADQKKEKKKVEPTQESIAKAVTGWERSHRYCPKCKRPIYKKQMENENGTYFLYGHTDWKTGECNYTTYDLANLLQEHEIKENEPLTEEQKENKSKLTSLFKGLFT